MYVAAPVRTVHVAARQLQPHLWHGHEFAQDPVFLGGCWKGGWAVVSGVAELA
ncbi:hypothetical protein [Micromonospora sp. DT233]|uniref:hypothetical protein n=1 Tax=Micromonospora sp. DT233 TaxID=3393432 RepID=UPI003CE9A488